MCSHVMSAGVVPGMLTDSWKALTVNKRGAAGANIQLVSQAPIQLCSLITMPCGVVCSPLGKQSLGFLRHELAFVVDAIHSFFQVSSIGVNPNCPLRLLTAVHHCYTPLLLRGRWMW